MFLYYFDRNIKYN